MLTPQALSPLLLLLQLQLLFNIQICSAPAPPGLPDPHDDSSDDSSQELPRFDGTPNSVFGREIELYIEPNKYPDAFMDMAQYGRAAGMRFMEASAGEDEPFSIQYLEVENEEQVWLNRPQGTDYRSASKDRDGWALYEKEVEIRPSDPAYNMIFQVLEKTPSRNADYGRYFTTKYTSLRLWRNPKVGYAAYSLADEGIFIIRSMNSEHSQMAPAKGQPRASSRDIPNPAHQVLYQMWTMSTLGKKGNLNYIIIPNYGEDNEDSWKFIEQLAEIRQQRESPAPFEQVQWHQLSTSGAQDRESYTTSYELMAIAGTPLVQPISDMITSLKHSTQQKAINEIAYAYLFPPVGGWAQALKNNNDVRRGLWVTIEKITSEESEESEEL